METAIRHHAPIQGGRLPASEATTARDLDRVLAYHQRTKHHLERYAAGPEALDWSSQPDPFRSFKGAPTIPLPLGGDSLVTPFGQLQQPGQIAPQPLSLNAIAVLLELSMGLSAWKEYGPDRWALRCNPSSGNLHPTEAYLVSQGVPDLADGVYHYLSRDHTLEQRAACGSPDSEARAWIGLSSIHWREAWKYGERAFRYCQLDTGHALGALRYAAAALGWGLRLVPGVGSQALGGLLGLDRAEDFFGTETEEAEVLLEVMVGGGEALPPPEPLSTAAWKGRANVLDPHPMYHWPVIDEVAESSRAAGEAEREVLPFGFPPRTACLTAEPASTLIRRRRSAQRFDNRPHMGAHQFYTILDALLPRRAVPWDVWDFAPRLHPVLFVHRVEGLAPGLYALLRDDAAGAGLRAAMLDSFAWTRPAGAPAHLPLYLLAEAGCGQLAKAIHCHQAIAADSGFALGMLAEFEETLSAAPWRYRQLHWEAGLLGQVLYLEAEAAGLRGTGIGCYFDDSFHQLLGLTGNRYQSLYHFTVGFPLTDTRILTLPPYPGRQP